MRTIINFFLFLAISTASLLALAQAVSGGFNKRGEYLNKTQLGNPSTASKVIDTNGDVSQFGNLNDSGLVDRGKDLLRSSEHGKLLQNAEEKKIDAAERYKINPNNGWLKNSLLIEENPMSKTGGKGLSMSEKVTSIVVKKSCVEGVDFNVDVGVELVLEVEEEEYLGPPLLKPIDIPYIQTPRHWWHSQQYSEGNLNLNKSAGGFSFGYKTAINSLDILNQIQLEISKRLNEQGVVTVPQQDIILHFYTIGLPTRNVVHPNGPRNGFLFKQYSAREAIIKFHYNSQERLKKLVEKAEYWQVVTEGMEQLAEANECYETGRVCLKSGVKTFLGKYDISRPCWYEKISYRCTSEPKGGCDHLIRQDCKLKDSVCEHQIGNICLRWKRDYECGGQKKELHYSLADSPIYCLGGNCHTPTLEENKDFANVAYLAALNEAKKDCTQEGNSGICKNPITVFPGQVDGCRKIITGFINCCSSMKGWGNNTKLCKCSGNEKGLALKREKGLCHTVGTYCSQRDPIFKQCLTKKTNYCCFSSKLARIFQEQGRMQLGIGWGSASSPNCQPLTLDQLTKLDFSKFDMDELFDALLSKGKSNMNKTFPVLKPGEVPAIQQEHMKTK